jgi:hypothetical protein
MLRSPSGAARSTPRRRCQSRCRACARATAGTSVLSTSSPNRTGPLPAAASRTGRRPSGSDCGRRCAEIVSSVCLHVRPPARRHDVPPAAGQRHLGGREPDPVILFDTVLGALLLPKTPSVLVGVVVRVRANVVRDSSRAMGKRCGERGPMPRMNSITERWGADLPTPATGPHADLEPVGFHNPAIPFDLRLRGWPLMVMRPVRTHGSARRGLHGVVSAPSPGRRPGPWGCRQSPVASGRSSRLIRLLSSRSRLDRGMINIERSDVGTFDWSSPDVPLT